ncbi:MAG: hypothetical protein DRR19_20145 [Candidatus Parabeggiatoa sp. nov. 1]|nr:MAG: hypothetical protein DRR19_20145 [Gammaproteobacteria bacterium]
MEASTQVLLPENEMEMVFVELPKFDKKEDALSSTADKWIYFIKQVGQLTSIPKVLADDETINHAFEVANAASLTPEEQDIQEKKARWLADHKEVEQERAEKQMAIAEKQAALAKLAQSETKLAQSETKVAQFKAEKQAALEKAEQTEKNTTLRLAKQMLQANADIALIMQVTGLNEASIKQLSESFFVQM